MCEYMHVSVCGVVSHTTDAIEWDCIQNPLTVCASADTLLGEKIGQAQTKQWQNI